MCRRSVVTSGNKDNSKGKEPVPYQDNSAFLFEKQDENGNFLLLLTATLNLTISRYWSISEKEIILCGDSTFRSFGKVSEGLGSSVCYIYTVKSLLRETE